MMQAVRDNAKGILAGLLVVVLTMASATVIFTAFPNVPPWAGGLAIFVVMLVLACLATLVFNRRRKHPGSVSVNELVAFDTEGITRTMGDGRTEFVRWDDLQEVGIVTTDEGPAVDDVFWVLLGSKGGCAVPSEAEGMKELLERLQQLPEFDNEAVIKAMGSTSNNRFVCWRRIGKSP